MQHTLSNLQIDKIKTPEDVLSLTHQRVISVKESTLGAITAGLLLLAVHGRPGSFDVAEDASVDISVALMESVAAERGKEPSDRDIAYAENTAHELFRHGVSQLASSELVDLIKMANEIAESAAEEALATA